MSTDIQIQQTRFYTNKQGKACCCCLTVCRSSHCQQCGAGGEFGESIRAVSSKIGITQKQLSEALGYSKGISAGITTKNMRLWRKLCLFARCWYSGNNDK